MIQVCWYCGSRSFTFGIIFKRNNEGEKRTSAIEFSTILYMLHYYTLRILRSPWRKDYLTIKVFQVI